MTGCKILSSASYFLLLRIANATGVFGFCVPSPNVDESISKPRERTSISYSVASKAHVNKIIRLANSLPGQALNPPPYGTHAPFSPFVEKCAPCAPLALHFSPAVATASLYSGLSGPDASSEGSRMNRSAQKLSTG